MTKVQRALLVAHAIRFNLPLNTLSSYRLTAQADRVDGKPALRNKTAPFALYLSLRKRGVVLASKGVGASHGTPAAIPDQSQNVLLRLYERVNGDAIYISLDRMVRVADFLLDLPIGF